MHTYKYLSIALILTFSIPAHAQKSGLNPVVALLMMVAPVKNTPTYSPHADSAARASGRHPRIQSQQARKITTHTYAARRSVQQPASHGRKRG